MSAIIPKGTLSKGDRVDDMLMPFIEVPQDTEGLIVRYTDKNGEVHVAPWCNVADGKVIYIASVSGTYELVRVNTSFPDVNSSYWGYKDVIFAANRGLFKGDENGIFDAKGTMSRGMFVTVLGRLQGIDTAKYSEKIFDDVKVDSWYGPYVAWAFENKISDGIGNNLFDPNAPISREQICTLLVRYLDSQGIKIPEGEDFGDFPDTESISGWALDAVNRFKRTGIVKGNEYGEFKPQDNASRGAGATIYFRLEQT